MLVYDFMSEYNYKRKKYGKKYVDKYIVWQGYYNGLEVEKHSCYFCHFKKHWFVTELKYTKEVRDV